jgi:hypothetical protein
MSFDGNMRLILHDADADAGDELQISTLGLMKNFLWVAVGNKQLVIKEWKNLPGEFRNFPLDQCLPCTSFFGMLS